MPPMSYYDEDYHNDDMEELTPLIEKYLGPEVCKTPPDREKLRAAANTAKTLAELDNKPLEISEESAHLAQTIFRDGRPITKLEMRMPEVVVKLDALLTAYDYDLLADATRIRNYVVNKLIQEADGEEGRIRIKALELLGKLTEVAAFTDRQEISITHQTTEDLQSKLRERLNELIEVEDVEIVEDKLSADDVLRAL